MSAFIIKNGFTYDPLTGEYGKSDIGIKEERIVNPKELKGDSVTEIDAEGCLAIPGLIDYHIHLYTGCSGGVNADRICLPSGVTTAVDGGTCGFSNYEDFREKDILNTTVRVKSYLHVTPMGLAGSEPEDVNPELFQLEPMQRLFEKYPDELLAVKFRISKDVVEPGGYVREPFEKALQIAGSLGRPLVVHMNDPVFAIEEVTSMLRPGDVFCHMYHGMGETIVDEEGNIKPAILKARERGVVFDASNGRNNFAFRTAVPALEKGFFPDIISSDISPMTCYQQPVINLPWIMSKYMNMGMDFKQVIDRATLNPARMIGMEELATLKEGTIADIAIMRIVEKPVVFEDYLGESCSGSKVLLPQMTLKNGKIMYRQTGFQ